MTLKQQIDQDIKHAMLSGDKTLAETLRGLKSAILYVELSKGKRGDGLGDAEVIEVLTKESKKRQESADLFKRGGNEMKHQAELAEKEVIQKYLPEQMSESDISKLIDEVINGLDNVNPQMMGQIIGAVKTKAGAAADGAVIAKLVKEKLS